MKNKTTQLLIASAFFALSTNAFAQEGRVGINTAEPKTTLDVNGKKDALGNLLVTDITGLQAPRLTRAELTDKGDDLYSYEQQGALVYITDISGGDDLTQRVNITATGYYYFDGELWQEVRIEPWYDKATKKPASQNTQDIYQMGSVGVGTKTIDSFYGKGKFSVFVSGQEAGSSINTGIYNNFVGRSSSGGAGIGFLNYTTINRTDASSSIGYGINNSMTDNSTTTGSTTGINNDVYVSNGRTDTSTVSSGVTGIRSYVNINPNPGSDYIGANATGINNYLNLTARFANVSVNASAASTPVTASNNILALAGFAGRTLTVNGTDNSVGNFVLNANSDNSSLTGNLIASNLEGVHSQISFGYGSISATNVAGVKSHTRLLGNGSKTFTNLYGLLVSKAQSGSGAAISNSYGVYIQPYRFTGDTAANAYNVYSEGANTKNYFQGKVGIGAGASAPVSNLKVTGLQNIADNTAALSAGLAIGDFYHTNGVVKVVY